MRRALLLAQLLQEPGPPKRRRQRINAEGDLARARRLLKEVEHTENEFYRSCPPPPDRHHPGPGSFSAKVATPDDL